MLPYELQVKEVFPENVQTVTEFAKKTGDYPSLSATDIKVMALTYQLEKEKVGVKHLRTEPVMQGRAKIVTKNMAPKINTSITGFHVPGQKPTSNSRTGSRTVSISEIEVEKQDLEELNKQLEEKFKSLECTDAECVEDENVDEMLASVDHNTEAYEDKVEQPNISDNEQDSEVESDDDDGWITPSNIHIAKKQVNGELMEDKCVKVACITTDFAMQNVLKQMNLNVSALDGRIIKQLRTFILRCYTCFKTTSIMTKKFCPKCGNSTLKRVACSLDKDGKMQIHINAKRPLTARGKRFSLPTFKGGKHANNPILFEDQPMPDQKPTRLARMKNNPLNDDYIAGK